MIIHGSIRPLLLAEHAEEGAVIVVGERRRFPPPHRRRRGHIVVPPFAFRSWQTSPIHGSRLPLHLPALHPPPAALEAS